jgi:hypothetical protein
VIHHRSYRQLSLMQKMSFPLPYNDTHERRNSLRKPGLKGLRRHDRRHNWITTHAEIGTPQSVLQSQAGQQSKRMSKQYKHISEKAARKASDAFPA